MSVSQNDTYGIGVTQIAVGLSQVVRVTTAPQQSDWTMKILSGGGTLEIVPIQLSGSSTAPGNAWSKGYPVGASEILTGNGPATYYFAATGATMIVAAQMKLTAGCTLL